MQVCANRGGSGDQEGAEQQIREWGGHGGDPHLSRWFPTTTSFSSTMLGCWSCRSRVISRRLLTGIPVGSNCHCLEQGRDTPAHPGSRPRSSITIFLVVHPHLLQRHGLICQGVPGPVWKSSTDHALRTRKQTLFLL